MTTSFWQYDLSLIFTNILKTYAIIVFANIPDLKFLFWVRGSLSYCYVRSPFWDTDILILVISVLYELKHHITIDRQRSCKEEKKCLVGHNSADRKVLLAFSGDDYIPSFLKRGKENMLAGYWEMSKTFNLLQKVRYQPRTAWRTFWVAS